MSAQKPSTNASTLKKTTRIKKSAAHPQNGGNVHEPAKPTKTTDARINPAIQSPATQPLHNTSPLKQDTTHELIVTLLLNHPIPFNLKAPKPLAIGIHKEIFECYPQYSRKVIRFALHKWARRRQYVAVLQPNAVRYSLDGKPAGKVEVVSP